MENQAITSTVNVTTVDTPNTVTTTIVPATNTNAVTTTKSKDKMKKRGALHMLRVAMFMLRRKTNKQSKSVQVDVASKGLWKRVVGSMRPLHLQDNQNSDSPLHAQVTAPAATMIDMGPKNVVPIPKNDSFHDFPASPISPLQVNHTDSASSSTASLVSLDSTMSRYASAQNLQELDKSSNCDGNKGVTFEIVIGDEDEDYVGGDCGDEMIDARAEEFIAQFYEQMRLQQEDLLNSYNEKKKNKNKNKMAAMGDN